MGEDPDDATPTPPTLRQVKHDARNVLFPLQLAAASLRRGADPAEVAARLDSITGQLEAVIEALAILSADPDT